MFWKQIWNNYGLARNYVSKKLYRGINVLIFNNIDYEYLLFLMFFQVKEFGGYIKKGLKSIEVIYWKILQFEDEEKIKWILFFRYYNVFNVECVEGIKFKFLTKYINDFIDVCEIIVNDMLSKLFIEYGGDELYYNWQEDCVKVLYCENFIFLYEYYAILFYEFVHSTGYVLRFNRDICMKFVVYGLRDYCKEELVVEIVMCFLCGEVGIFNKIIDNSSVYI